MSEPAVAAPAPVVAAPAALEFLYRAGTLLSASLDYEHTMREVAQLAVPEVADWCAVFVVDDDGVEREITSRHPDAEIEALLLDIRRRRREREGSESLDVIRSGRSILATDVRDSPPDDVSAAEREGLARLAARSYMIVPLRARGRVIGALTLLSAREGRHYLSTDLAFAETLAVRCALNIDNARLFDAAERSLALLDTLFSTAPVGLAFLDAEQRYVRINGALAELNGRAIEEHIGRSVEEVMLGPLAQRVAATHRAVISSGESLLNQDESGVADEATGVAPHWLSSYTPVRAPDGEVIGVSVAVVDITERRQLLEAEREARVRADFLARAGAILDSSLDYEETLANVARIAVSEVADWCSLSVLDGSGVLAPVATTHSNPEREALARELHERFPADPRSDTGSYRVARTGLTEVTREITDEMLEAAVADPEQLELIRKLELRSSILAPLRARGRTFGVLALVSAESGRQFNDADVQLAEELARRAGVAIDNARLYTERTHIAHTLQVKLLPEHLPQIPGALLAARYRAAGELNEVGGDFYDVFPRSAEEWALVVGDVSGKGAEAAAITALARYTLRAAAMDAGPPSQALDRLNATMLADGSSQFATVVLAYASCTERGGLRVRMSLGGHPPPLILRAGGEVEVAGTFGSVLGVIGTPRLIDSEIQLDPADVLLLYTDGVTEAGPRADPVGQQGLTKLLAGLAGTAPQPIVDAVERAVVLAQPGEPRDDLALLALGVRG